jgi:hypothetical protein
MLGSPSQRLVLSPPGSNLYPLLTLVSIPDMLPTLPTNANSTPADRDGTMDMVFITCSSVTYSTGVGTGCSINIAYNKQLQLCTSSTDSGIKKGQRTCRPPEQLCTADPNFYFDFTEGNDNDVGSFSLYIQSLTMSSTYRHSFESQFTHYSLAIFPFWFLTQRILHASRYLSSSAM